MILNDLYKTIKANNNKENFVEQLISKAKGENAIGIFILFTALNLNHKMPVEQNGYELLLYDHNKKRIWIFSPKKLLIHKMENYNKTTYVTFLNRSNPRASSMVHVVTQQFLDNVNANGFRETELGKNMDTYRHFSKIQKIGIFCKKKQKIALPDKSETEFYKLFAKTLIFDYHDLDDWRNQSVHKIEQNVANQVDSDLTNKKQQTEDNEATKQKASIQNKKEKIHLIKNTKHNKTEIISESVNQDENSEEQNKKFSTIEHDSETKAKPKRKYQKRKKIETPKEGAVTNKEGTIQESIDNTNHEVKKAKDRQQKNKKKTVNKQKVLTDVNFLDSLDADSTLESRQNKQKQKESLELRLHQEYIISKTRKIINYDPDSPVLWKLLPRCGKSIMISALVCDFDNKKHVKEEEEVYAIMCSNPSEVKNKYSEIFNKYSNLNAVNIISIIANKSPLIKKGKNLLLIPLTIIVNDENVPTPLWIKKIKFEYLFIDDIYYQDENILAINDKIETTFSQTRRVYISATFQQKITNFKIAKERQIYWRIEDVKHCQIIQNPVARNALIKFHDGSGAAFFEKALQKSIELAKDYLTISTIYDKYPALEIITVPFNQDYNEYLNNIDENVVQHNLTIHSLFETLDNNFEHSQRIIDIFKRIFGTKNDRKTKNTSLLERCFQIAKTKYYAKNMRWFSTSSPKIILCFLPSKFKGIFSFRKLIINLKSLLEEHDICPDFYVSGVISNPKQALDDANQYIKEHTNIKGIILLLSANTLCGVSIPSADIVLQLNDTQTMNEICNSAFRCISEDLGKKVGFYIDLEPQRPVMFAANDYECSTEQRKNKGNNTKIDLNRFQDGLININTDEYVDKKSQKINVKKLMNMVSLMNDIYAHQILNPQNVNRGSRGPIQSFFEKKNLFIKKGRGDKLVDFFQTLFNTDLIQELKDNNILRTESDGQIHISDHKSEADDNSSLDLTLSQANQGSKISKSKKEKAPKVSGKNLDSNSQFQYTHDIFPPLAMLMCYLTIFQDSLTDLRSMSNYINQEETLKNYLLFQLNLWWSGMMKKEFNGNLDYTNLVELYYQYFFDETFNKWLADYKTNLVNLCHIEARKVLSTITDEVFIPRITDKKVLSGLTTPKETRQQMLNLIPRKFWESPRVTIFDPFCGKGGFIVDIIELLMNGLRKIIPNEDDRYRHIIEKQVFFADPIEFNVWITKMILNPNKNEFHLNAFVENAISTKKWFKIKNFDLIIANPPINETLNKANDELIELAKCIKKFASKINNYYGLLLMTCPTRWRSDSLEQKSKKIKELLLANNIQKIVLSLPSNLINYVCSEQTFDFLLLQKIKNQDLTEITNIKKETYKANLNDFSTFPVEKIVKK